MPPYTIGRLAPLRQFELLALYLRAVLPGKSPAEKHSIEACGPKMSRDALISGLLDLT